MIDKLLGSDEEINSTKKHRGGELVEIGDEEASNPWTDSTATAQNDEEAVSTYQARAEQNIDQTGNDYEDEESSSYEEQYENDFHEILEEVVRHQADLEEDRDDDMDLNESDTTMQSSFVEEKKGAASSETTQDPNESQTNQVTKKRVANNQTTTASAGELQNLVDGGVTPGEEEDHTGEFDGGRDTSNEERIWQQVIDRHGRQDFNTVYTITNKYVSISI